MPENHFPDKVSYELNDVFKDLLVFAYDHLKPNGRLLFWFPVAKDELESKLKKQLILQVLPEETEWRKKLFK